MAEVISKKDLIKQVAEKLDTRATLTVASVTDAVFDVITENLAKGNEVQLRWFGRFKIVKKAERKGRNPRTGEEITIPAHKSPVFSPSKTLKDAVK